LKKIYIIFRLYKPLEACLIEKKLVHNGSPAYFNFIKYIQDSELFDPHVYLILDKKSSSLYNNFEIEISGIKNKVKVFRYINFRFLKNKIKTELILNRLIQYVKIYFNTDKKQIYYLDRDNILLSHLLKFKNGTICFRLLGITKKLFQKLFGDKENKLFSNPLKNNQNLIICTNDGSWSLQTKNNLSNPNFHVLLNGCDFKFKKHNELNDTIKFLCVSRIETGKGIDSLLHIMSKLKSKGFDNFRLEIVGSGSLLNEMINLSNELGLKQNCVFLGQMPHNLVINHLQKANIFVSLNKLGYLGNNVIESLSQGIPTIIDTNGLSIPLEFKKPFIKIDTKNIDKSSSIIFDFCSSVDNYRNLQIQSRSIFIAKFNNWKKRINDEINLINEFMENKT
jgi:glycosyltransferase involved in cell wall biosynthesis